MHMRYAALLLPLLLVPLLVTSPVACGCEPDLTSMAGQMSIYVPYAGTAVSADKNQFLGQSAFVGKDIHHLAPGVSPDPECVWTSPTHLVCTYWNETGILYSTGRVVHVTAGANDMVTGVAVSTVRRLFGVSLGAAA